MSTQSSNLEPVGEQAPPAKKAAVEPARRHGIKYRYRRMWTAKEADHFRWYEKAAGRDQALAKMRREDEAHRMPLYALLEAVER